MKKSFFHLFWGKKIPIYPKVKNNKINHLYCSIKDIFKWNWHCFCCSSAGGEGYDGSQYSWGHDLDSGWGAVFPRVTSAPSCKHQHSEEGRSISVRLWKKFGPHGSYPNPTPGCVVPPWERWSDEQWFPVLIMVDKHKTTVPSTGTRKRPSLEDHPLGDWLCQLLTIVLSLGSMSFGLFIGFLLFHTTEKYPTVLSAKQCLLASGWSCHLFNLPAPQGTGCVREFGDVFYFGVFSRDLYGSLQ